MSSRANAVILEDADSQNKGMPPENLQAVKAMLAAKRQTPQKPPASMRASLPREVTFPIGYRSFKAPLPSGKILEIIVSEFDEDNYLGGRTSCLQVTEQEFMRMKVPHGFRRLTTNDGCVMWAADYNFRSNLDHPHLGRVWTGERGIKKGGDYEVSEIGALTTTKAGRVEDSRWVKKYAGKTLVALCGTSARQCDYHWRLCLDGKVEAGAKLRPAWAREVSPEEADRNLILSIGNLRFVKMQVNFDAAMEFANAPGRRAAQIADVMDPEVKRLLGSFLSTEHTFVWLRGGKTTERTPMYLTAGYAKGAGLVCTSREPSETAKWAVYVVV